ncbi:MAG: alkaline phosphatase family protein [Kiritimatiellae bacterium]|jgi:predicted AlkP superfamily pyrophosphatase or phosphodiesterase|nr:alkaline phosphatase family protein [Kiritimatiellia bacterium]MDD2348738.1 alkaline phosphatase family protein [Kiritimatiellia bacterium]MDD3585167.1 alkaline phosphatase family protein [Kiritimatiellia bacterium]HHU14878.1 alkaline phosphatase family protein [Lentisphaerota bacterium]HON47869.1 alkaline phosphatase family protein [Kiritimatiellia bacterium]
MKKLLVIQVAALGHAWAERHGVRTVAGLPLRPLAPVFPALTCTAQATLRTGLTPAAHGMVANGFFDPTLRRASFWEQSSALVQGPRIWQAFRDRGGTVGMTFFQQSLGESVDLVFSPAPIHKHSGGMIMGCYGQPSGLEARLTAHAGSAFRLSQYWGPLASVKASEWITEAIAGLLAEPDAPDLLFTYLPGLDYDLQRFGPDHPRSLRALKTVHAELERLFAVAAANDYEVAAFGDYAITPVTGAPVFPNRALRATGLMAVRDVRGMLYPDFYQSRAFAVVDHQVALVSVLDPSALPRAAEVLGALEGVAQVLDKAGQAALGVDHPRAGELLLVASPGYWFAYPWWDTAREAPDYAGHVDIHSKPGFDPCELFFDRLPFRTCQDRTRIRGTHGLAGPDCETAFVSTQPFACSALPEFAAAVRAWLAPT